MLKQIKEIISRFNVWRKHNPLGFAVSIGVLVIFVWIAIVTIRQGKTLWDWLELIIVPLAVALTVYWLNSSQKKRENERQLDSQRQSTLQAYYDKMSELLLDKGLGDDNETPSKAAVVARALTLSAFRNLDANRNAAILRFLSDAGLLKLYRILNDFDMLNIDFSKANLREAYLVEAYLSRANLSGANLDGANLGESDLSEANLSGANLSGANLTKAYLREANLQKANLRGAHLSQVMLHETNLYEANLSGAELFLTDLKSANLEKTDIHGAKYHKRTKWPDNFNPKEAGAVLVDNLGQLIEEDE